ncbi:Powdery mildew resistance protein [Parasponia andersonii]|uniref:Powdery mildew resistance protein n=1 Tax=Parasponia andersonii TaxID=3476 RepID=A0A2P5ADI1_PARAD|nr:Powdery mildew resistance protein [Parasponia andersonii]
MNDNMASLVGGAALGPPFQMLVDLIKIQIVKARIFKAMLNKIKLKVEVMDPFIKQITQSNVALDRPLSETEGFVNIIGKGNELVGKCSKYTRTTNETQILVKEIYANTTGRTQMSNDLVNNTQTGIKGSCRALEPPAFTVGLEKPFEELTMKLLRDDKPTVTTVVTAPPGCGKTTLAKRICKDDQIKGTLFISGVVIICN